MKVSSALCKLKWLQSFYLLNTEVIPYIYTVHFGCLAQWIYFSSKVKKVISDTALTKARGHTDI